MASPWLISLYATIAGGRTPAGKPETLELSKPLIAWHDVLFNGSILLLLLCVVGFLLSYNKKSPLAPSLFLPLGYSLVVAVLVYAITGIAYQGRFILVALMPSALLAAACIHSLYRYKKRLGLLCLAWAVAGILFQQSRAYEAYTLNRKTFADLLPWHAISRVAEQARMPFPIITYGADLNRLRLDSRFGGSQHEHYFARPGLSLASYADLDSTVRQIRHKAFWESAFWLVFRAQENDADAAASLRSVPLEVNYAPCETRTVGADSTMILYHWAALHCQTPALKAIYQTELANYEFFGSWLDASKSNLLFIFRWTARTDFAAHDYNISHQLIGTDGEKRAQLDLHLANEGELKQFALNVSEAPAGEYHLVAIVYDSKTNRKLNWQADTGMMPHIQLPVSVTLARN